MTPPVKEISPVVLLKNSSVQLVIKVPVLSNLTTSTKFFGKVIVAFQRLAFSASARVNTLTENSWFGRTEAGDSRVKEFSGVVPAGEGLGEPWALNVTEVDVRARARLVELSRAVTIVWVASNVI